MQQSTIPRILFVEDLPSDMELAEHQLRSHGFQYEAVRVETEPDFLQALEEFRPDLVVSDYSLPLFDGRRALELTLKHDPDLPFVILTGSMNEETAVDCMKAGAVDYLIKGQTKRLVFALLDALDHRRTRLAKREAELALRDSEIKARFLAENISDVLSILDPETMQFTYISSSVERLLGYSVDEMMAKGLRCFLDDEAHSRAVRQTQERAQRFIDDESSPESHSYTEEGEQIRKDGTRIWTEVVTQYLRNQHGEPTVIAIGRDISRRKLSETQLRLQATALESTANAIVITNPDCVIEWVNPAFSTLTGYTSAEAVGKPSRELLHSGRQSPEFYKQMWDTILAGNPWSGQLVNRRKDGSLYIEAQQITPVMEDGVITHFVAVKEDVTDRIQAQQALQLSEERYDLAARAANDALWDIDLRTQTAYVSPRFGELLGFPPGEGPRSIFELEGIVHPEDRDRMLAGVNACIAGSIPKFESDHRLRCKDTTYRWFRARGLAVRDASGHPLRLAGSMSDITDRKVAEQQLLHDAFHDALTGLPNRALFFDRLETAVRRGRRDGELWFAVMMLDLDRFKTVNDSLGHLAGDKLLIEIGGRIANCIRRVDTLARLGGDEFAILLEGPKDEGSALRVADRIVRELMVPLNIQEHEIVSSVSIGIAFGNSTYVRAEDIIRDADIALYRAKASGRGHYEIFDPKMHQQALAALEIEQDLRGATARGELILHYQPIVTLRDGKVEGFEALVRWNHPRRGLVPPSTFIPLAEETGLIKEIGEWVIREACEALRRMDQCDIEGAANLHMSVNLSPRQVYQPGIVELVRGIVERAGVSSRRIRLEITESVLMDQPELATSVLTRFSDAGFTIHLDDFGTGYSSLKYLLEFPIHSIKIDRSFVKLLPDDRRAKALVQSVLMLAAQLELGVTAEGVETQAQLQSLRDMECEKLQGYLIAPPLTYDAAMKLLGEDQTW